LDFGEIFKDAEKLKQIHKIMTDTSYEAKNQGVTQTLQEAAGAEGDELDHDVESMAS